MADYAKGGILPSRKGDENQIPVMWDSGYMLSASQVRELGTDFFRKLNEGLTSGA